MAVASLGFNLVLRVMKKSKKEFTDVLYNMVLNQVRLMETLNIGRYWQFNVEVLQEHIN
jgi:hypothetical protein